ncbi:TPA: Txe/YoeB family addiction module toxin [Candidatus Dojkabacteria bacterium]|uniref:Putative mRNA interferase YoeB n=1 Tax=Candidatus Dojkabacteria bacterium TaxID=2099670 RepID=A0A832QFW4_9BACT|nr:Txe/YoeB family addiction module toxin [Candidatus Dojkabacteria bacterium]
MYKVFLSKKALKDRKLLKEAGLEKKARGLLKVLTEDPFQTPPSYESLRGELEGYYSRRINIQHRLVYSVDRKMNEVFVYRMWTRYEC